MSVETSSEAGSFVFIREILRDLQVTDRCLRKWVAAGRFPRPAGNLNGRNFWLREQLEQWRADALAGRYRLERLAFRTVRRVNLDENRATIRMRDLSRRGGSRA